MDYFYAMVSEHTGQKKKSHAEKNFDEPHQVVTEEIASPRAKNEIMRGHFF